MPATPMTSSQHRATAKTLGVALAVILAPAFACLAAIVAALGVAIMTSLLTIMVLPDDAPVRSADCARCEGQPGTA